MDNEGNKVVKKPGKVQAIGIMTLVGGVLGILYGAGGILYFLIFGLLTYGILCIFIPLPIYSLIMGIMALMKGIKLVKDRTNFEKPSKNIAIMQIINIVCFDFWNVVLGILEIIFIGDPEVEEYYQD